MSYIVRVDVPRHITVGDQLTVDITTDLGVPPAIVDVDDADHVPLENTRTQRETIWWPTGSYVTLQQIKERCLFSLRLLCLNDTNGQSLSPELSCWLRYSDVFDVHCFNVYICSFLFCFFKCCANAFLCLVFFKRHLLHIALFINSLYWFSYWNVMFHLYTYIRQWLIVDFCFVCINIYGLGKTHVFAKIKNFKLKDYNA